MAGIYLHIPFCKKRCIYCDFFSTTLSYRKAEYVQALCHELESRVAYLNKEPIETIYFGGGTPSQLTNAEIKEIINTLFSHYEILPNAEITLEANPDDLTTEFVNGLRSLPINRISMGIQTFQDNRLQILNRRHNAEEARLAVKRCQEAGYNNISIDLMYGLPGETMQEWEADLQQALQLGVQHLSAYHLIYEEGTILSKLHEQHRVKEVDEDMSLSFFETLIATLKQGGFEHYEISNFCKKGFASRHNSNYWNGIPYLGCGAAAHSFNGVSRQWNINSLDTYIKGINQNNPVIEKEILDKETQYNEYIMTGLRTCKGINLTQLEQKFGLQLKNYCMRMAEPHLQDGTLECTNNSLKLSHRGIFISDGIMSDLMSV